MRIHYYRFPKNTPEEDRLREGCAVILKDGSEIHVESIPEDKRPLVDRVDDLIGGISITHAKQLLRRYGGSAFTEHCERDGGVFEVTEISLRGNNSHFKYNHHL